ncbi:hypothetical protein RMSM_03091 [Rhodopirellula maiorica SM1]|uniref:Uncharacterized protein n=1 Tax=Rhodopirellula maiorica SM1 TaxID=1265738 RepID=M5RL00_9BACT|nr:hypothetical protein RMSM_03091 [Rhodopirellula maiorica SM1]
MHFQRFSPPKSAEPAVIGLGYRQTLPFDLKNVDKLSAVKRPLPPAFHTDFNATNEISRL